LNLNQLSHSIVSENALADSSAVRFRTLPLRLRHSISFAVSNFASVWKYKC